MARRTSLDGVTEYLNQQGIPITRETSWRWARDGYLPCIKIGKQTQGKRQRYTYAFDLEDIDAWLDSQKTEGHSERIPEITI